MLDQLRRIIQEISSADHIERALNIVVQRVCETLNTDSASVYLTDSKGLNYILVASKGFQPNIANISVATEQGLVGLVGRREEPISCENAQDHPLYHCIPGIGEESYHAFLGVPIIHQRQLLGVLVVQNKTARRYSESEETFLITLSAQTAGVIAHAEATGAICELKGVYDLTEDSSLSGQPGASGVAIGTAVVVYPLANLEAVPYKEITNINEEIKLFNEALSLTRLELEQLEERLSHLPDEERSLFDAYLKILDKASLGQEVEEKIREGEWAQSALRAVIRSHVRQFEAMEDVYLRERAADLRDLGNRVLAHLQAKKIHKLSYPRKTILVGDEVTATRLAEVPRDRLVGLVCLSGSSNAHVAIMARSLGIPAVMGAKGLPLMQLDGRSLIVDGYNGRVHISPSASLKSEYKRIIQEEKELFRGLSALKKEPSLTPDGHHMPLYVNTGLESSFAGAAEIGASGVGLYRTEVAFMVRDGFPSEEQQRLIYRKLLESFAPKMVIVRTLDVGGDKNLPYFPVEEENPSLGWRGIRVTLDHPEIFLVQIRALLRACDGLDNLKIMLPMVTHLSEIDESLRLVTQAYSEILEEGTKLVMPQVGAMIEVPSAVYQVRKIAQRLDFLSVGSNDLTQYLLAVDRNNARVADLYDTLHPAVLQALMQVVEGAHQEGKPVTLCGEMASDPAAAIVLLAMGYDGLSMNMSSLLKIKWVIRSIPLTQAISLLNQVLTLHDARAVRRVLNQALDEAGLGGLIRAGK